jgi:4-amino-4-deoxy-L-arabinose transferase-like glycosyltransferase
MAVIFVFALVPKVTYIALIERDLHSDEQRYLGSAFMLWHHAEYGKFCVPSNRASKGWDFEQADLTAVVTDPDAKQAGVHHQTDARLPVLYPLFLAPFVGVFGIPPTPALYAQAAIASATACLAYWLGRRLRGDLAGWLAGLLCASYVPMMRWPGQFMTETLSVCLMLLALLLCDLLFSARTLKTSCLFAGVAGAAFAFLSLTRPAHFPLVLVPLVICVLLMWRHPRRAVPVVAVLIGSFVLCYSPWVIRNYVTLGKVVVLLDGVGAPTDGEFHVEKLLLQGYTFREGRRLAHDWHYSGQAKYEPLERFSLEFARRCWLRFRIMLGAHPCLELPFPFAGQYVPVPWPLRWLNYGWALCMWVFTLMAFLYGLKKRDIRLLHTIAVPFALLCLYALVSAITRYQTVSYTALSVPAGIGVSVIFFAVAESVKRRFSPVSPPND